MILTTLTEFDLLKSVDRAKQISLLLFAVCSLIAISLVLWSIEPAPLSENTCVNYLLVSANLTSDDKEQLHILLNEYDDYAANKDKITIVAISNQTHPPMIQVRASNISDTPIWWFHDGSTISGRVIDADRIKKELENCV